ARTRRQRARPGQGGAAGRGGPVRGVPLHPGAHAGVRPVTRPVVVEVDGGARGNPGPAGWGAVVRDPATGEVLLERSEAIGRATNNVAEYGGHVGGPGAAAEPGAPAPEVRTGSELVIARIAA